MKFGAIHQPDSPRLSSAIDFNTVRVRGAARPTNWFETLLWQVEPDGDILLNDELSCCCEVADYRLIQAWMCQFGIQWKIPTELIKLRYRAVGGYQDTAESDNGTITQEDCFAWQASPIIANDRPWPAHWLTVQPEDVSAALKRAPLLGTIALTGKGDPLTWSAAYAGPANDYHRVVIGAERSGLLQVHSYGQRYYVHPSRFVAVDLMLLTDVSQPIKTAGIDWSALNV